MFKKVGFFSRFRLVFQVKERGRCRETTLAAHSLLESNVTATSKRYQLQNISEIQGKGRQCLWKAAANSYVTRPRDTSNLSGKNEALTHLVNTENSTSRDVYVAAS